jgi:hypothetical protein
MLGLLAAMTVAAAPAAHAVPVATPRPLFVLRRPLGLNPEEMTARLRCKDAARLMVGYEPALLFREQDRADAKARKLIDLPDGAMCLVRGAVPATGGGR